MTVSHVSSQALKYVLGSGAWADHSKAGVVEYRSTGWITYRAVHCTTSIDQQDRAIVTSPLTLRNPE